MPRINPTIILKENQNVIAEIAARLETDGVVHLRIPKLKSVIEKTISELAPHLTDYPHCEGVFYGYKTKRFGGVFTKSGASQSLATDPVIVGVMNKILQPYCDRIQINLTQAISIQPGETDQVPHRDDEAFPIPHSDQHFMINAIWALTDFNEKNGGTRVWPGSHRKDLTRTPQPEDRFVPDMQVGDVLLYLGSVLHHGGANQTQKPRNGLVVSYSLGWLRQAENQFLAYPADIAKDFPTTLQELIGYQAHRPNLGWVEGQDPSFLLKEHDPSANLPTADLLPPHLEKLAQELAA